MTNDITNVHHECATELVKILNCTLEDAKFLAKLALTISHPRIDLVFTIAASKFNSFEETSDYLIKLITSNLLTVTFDPKRGYSKLILNLPDLSILDKYKVKCPNLPVTIEPEEIDSIEQSPVTFDSNLSQTHTNLSHYNNTKSSLRINTSVLNLLNQTPLKLSLDCNFIPTPITPVNKYTMPLENSLIESNSKAYSLLQKFYIINFYDHRGRFYDRSYSIKVQGRDYQKAILRLSDTLGTYQQESLQSLTLTEKFSPSDWLYIHIATQADITTLDLANVLLSKEDISLRNAKTPASRCSFKHRIYMGKLIAKYYDLLTHLEFDSPCEVEVACKVANGLADSKGLMVDLDMAASGASLLALLTKDLVAATNTNQYGDSSKRKDVYTLIDKELHNITNTPVMATRKEAKKAVMTALYSSVQQPKAIYGTAVNDFYKAMENILPNPSAFMNEVINNEFGKGESYQWSMPDGHDVFVQNTTTEQWQGTFLGENINITKQLYGANPKARSLGANLVHSVDSLLAREVVMRMHTTKRNLDVLTKVKLPTFKLSSTTNTTKDAICTHLAIKHIIDDSISYDADVNHYIKLLGGNTKDKRTNTLDVLGYVNITDELTSSYNDYIKELSNIDLSCDVYYDVNDALLALVVSKYSLKEIKSMLDLLLSYKYSKASGFYSVRIFTKFPEIMNSFIKADTNFIKLNDTLPIAPAYVLCIHDCFRVEPAAANQLRAIVHEILAQIAESNLLKFMCYPVYSALKQANKMGSTEDGNKLAEFLRNNVNYVLG